MKKITRLLLSVSVLSTMLSTAQISIPNSTPVVEDFNSMNTGTTTPSNWRVFKGNTSVTWASALTTIDFEASSGAPTSGGFYNWGATGGVDRALGVMADVAFGSPNQILAEYQNTNTVSISSLAVSYDAEKYRNNTATASIANLQYSTNGTSWTTVTSSSVSNANLGGNSASSYGFPILSFSRPTFNITGLNIATGGKIYLRWNITTTATAPKAIGIDNVSVTATFAAAASQTAFTTVPANGFTTTNLTSIIVEARRPNATVDNSFTGNITLSKASGPGTLSGTTTVAAVAGIATFTAVQFDQVGSYTLDATGSGLSSATSTSISIAQAPVTWNCGTTAGLVTPSSGIPYPNLAAASAITRGNNNGGGTFLASSTVSSGYTGASGQFNARFAARTGALNTAASGSAYLEFTLTPDAGYYLSFDGIKFGSRSAATGPAAYSLRSSADNYVSDIATGTLTPGGAWALNNPTVTPVLSGTGTPITFRLYGYNGTGTTTAGTVNWRLDDIALTISPQLCVLPTVFNVTGGGSYCVGGSGLSVGLSGSQVGATYQLYKDGVMDGAPVSGTGSALSFGTKTAAGEYTIVATNTIGSCTSNMSGAVDIIINPLPTITVGGTSSIVVGAQATVNAGGADTYFWNTGATGSPLIVSPVTTTTYTVNGTVTSTGCSSSNTFTVSVLSPVSPNGEGDNSVDSTKIRDTYCGLTLNTLGTHLYCNPITGATAYEFRFVESGTAFAYYYSSGLNNTGVYLFNVPGLQYGKTYDVQARASVGGLWGVWGISCPVTIIGAPTTKLRTQYCGITIPTIGTPVYCDGFTGATRYRFHITDLSNSSEFFYTSTGNNTTLYPTWVPIMNYGGNYSIEVALEINGVFTSYGTSCNLSIGTVPATQIRSAYCNWSAPSTKTSIYCDPITAATAYQYEITNLTTPGPLVMHTQFGGTTVLYPHLVPGIVNNANYSIRVRAIVGSDIGPYGSSCSLTLGVPLLRMSNLESLAEEGVEDAFLNVFPNPSNGDIKLETNRTGTYLIINELGQVVRTIEISDINVTEDITGLDAGMYTVISNQADGFIRQKIVVTK